MKKFICAMTGLYFWVAFSPSAHALKMSPFKMSLPADAKNITQVYRIENNSDEPTAVQVGVQTWEIKTDGSEENRSAENEFSVFPAQIILNPHESRSVRVQWMGGKAIEQEMAYRVLVEQIPIPLKETPSQQTGVKMMLRFKAALYITPEDAKSDIKVKSYWMEGRRKDLVLTLVNEGKSHSLLKNPSVEIFLADGRKVTLNGDDLKDMAGENVHAGKERRFLLSNIAGMNEEPRDIKIYYDQGM